MNLEFDYLSVAYPVRPEAPPYVRKYYYIERPGAMDVILPVNLLPPDVTVTSTYAPSDIMSNRPLVFNTDKGKDLYYMQDAVTKEINFVELKKIPADALLIVRETSTPRVTSQGATGGAVSAPDYPGMANYPPPTPEAEQEPQFPPPPPYTETPP